MQILSQKFGFQVRRQGQQRQEVEQRERSVQKLGKIVSRELFLLCASPNLQESLAELLPLCHKRPTLPRAREHARPENKKKKTSDWTFRKQPSTFGKIRIHTATNLKNGIERDCNESDCHRKRLQHGNELLCLLAPRVQLYPEGFCRARSGPCPESCSNVRRGATKNTQLLRHPELCIPQRETDRAVQSRKDENMPNCTIRRETNNSTRLPAAQTPTMSQSLSPTPHWAPSAQMKTSSTVAKTRRELFMHAWRL